MARPDLKTHLGRRLHARLRRETGRFTNLDRHFDMAAFIAFDINQPAPSYPWFPGVCPSWDNSARRPPGKAIFFRNSTPTLFGDWIASKTRSFRTKGDANLIFINAWNEWAEGNHLEPCELYGHRWLEIC